ncbi:hypothetical protein IFM89_002229 [Coptis chinensis]|uniref:2-oxoacid dehydrogenase acyltransferase catalytic domain-containing protein n=1 Tax=Coptis chinensis TaxID=261450 RepID=A0A835M9A3_9MAGN|nr:hypothetical protein IFM89_002229 [Coptis chinensis]
MDSQTFQVGKGKKFHCDISHASEDSNMDWKLLIWIGLGTFTLSNLGMFGVDRFDAILPPGQGAIMAVGASKPTVVTGADGFFSVKSKMLINCDPMTAQMQRMHSQVEQLQAELLYFCGEGGTPSEELQELRERKLNCEQLAHCAFDAQSYNNCLNLSGLRFSEKLCFEDLGIRGGSSRVGGGGPPDFDGNDGVQSQQRRVSIGGGVGSQRVTTPRSQQSRGGSSMQQSSS